MIRIVLIAVFLAVAGNVKAGPPFITDDPEPVEYRHWEVYLTSMLTQNSSGLSGDAAETEVNYGVLPNLQLHMIPTYAITAPKSGAKEFGFGDMELGAKYRFIQQTDFLPDVACFPLLELPTGSASRGLGTGHPQVFLPIWMQKDFGKWSTFGGGGYWINPGSYNRNWGFVGWAAQYQVTDHLALGAEIFHQTSQSVGATSNTFINPGGTWDLSDEAHILFSVGHTIQGQSAYISYFGIQFTFGPK